MSRYPLFEHYPYELALASRQYEVALQEELDLLHVHYAIPHATTAYLAREMLQREHPIKVITTLHGTDITLVGQEASFFAITRFSIERSDGVTAVSHFLREETYRAFGCGNCAIAIVPNFVNLAEYHPGLAMPRQSLVPPDHRLMVHVSNFREVKRVRDVIRIFARVRRAMPATLVMVGDGPDRTDAEQAARELDVAADVRFLGRLDTVAPLLAAADLFVLPSQTESFGLAALEALACGTPVLAARVGGIPELITDDVEGLLEPVGSVEAMARRTIDLLKDGPRHARMREAAVARAAEFSTDVVVPKYEAFYRLVLDQ